MTEDLEAIDILSQRFADEVKTQDRFTSGDNAIILSETNPILAQGDKVLRMYETELAKAPDDADVKIALALHLYRMGWLQYEAFSPTLLRMKDAGDLMLRSANHAQKCCGYMHRSCELFPLAPSSSVLADVFRLAGFYGTAIHWLRVTEKLGEARNDTSAGTKAKAVRLDLEADGKISDPPLARNSRFPTWDTAGLQLSNQPLQTGPKSSPVSTNAAPDQTKGGCMGVLAFVACLAVVFVILLLVNGGSTASRISNGMATQPAYSATPNTSTTLTSSHETSTSHDAQNWQGEHFPQTRNGYLREADIQGWSYSGVRYALNEMYARHGYLFKDGPLRHQFGKFSWYHPTTVQTSAGIEAQFTPLERANQILLAERRKALVQAGKTIK